jgi:flavin reductase (DIM6/NTAB) family NADH-FMN oxidoreductase RutF
MESTPPVDAHLNVRDAFAAYPTGLVALAAEQGGEVEVMIASSFSVGVSQEPPLASVALQRTSRTWPVLGRAARIGVSVLSTEQGALTRQIASRDRDGRLVGVDLDRLPGGAVVLAGCAGWYETEVHEVHAVGDHDLVVLRVLGFGVDYGTEPLVWRLRRRWHAAADLHA